MTAKKNPPAPENQKIWGWFSDDGQSEEELTLAQAEKGALAHKKQYPDDVVTIYKVVATVENKPFIQKV